MLDIQTPRDYLSILSRRRRHLLIPLALGAVISAAAALAWPAVYRSVATILIEAPEVPRDLVSSTVTAFADQRVQVISQRVMTSPNLISVIEKLDLYSGKREREALSQVVERMRADTHLEIQSADVIDPRSGRAAPAMIAFTLAFDYGDPGKAQATLNELVSYYLDENRRTRRQRAVETTRFLTNEAARYRALVAGLESRLSDFKQAHAGRLPEQVAVKLEMKERAERELLEARRELQTLQQRRVILQAELTQIDPSAPSVLNPDLMSPRDRLRLLQSQFVTLNSRYGPDHPDVRKVAREIEGLRAEVGSGVELSALKAEREVLRAELSGLRQRYSEAHPDVLKHQRQLAELDRRLAEAPPLAPPPSKPVNPLYIQRQAQLAAIGSEIAAFDEKSASLEALVADYEQALLAAPEIERDYRLLLRDHESALANYKKILEKQSQAELGEALESQQKSEQFTLLESPILPIEPVKPNRLAIFVLGLVVALVFGAGLTMVAEILDDSIYGPRQLARIAGVAPLVVVPRIGLGGGDPPSGLAARAALLAAGALAAGLAGYAAWANPLPVEELWALVMRGLEGFGDLASRGWSTT